MKDTETQRQKDKKKLIIGLGNPGKEYENTYHNAGFLAVDAWMAQAAKSASDDGRPPTLKNYKKLFDFYETDEAIFVKPLTYMNESGKAVREALKKFCPGVSVSSVSPCLFVLHDDSDLTIGTYKISYARGSAGHKGVQSIIDALKTKAFTRIRIGIRPARETKRQKAGDFALKQITPANRKTLEQCFVSVFPRLFVP